MRRSSEKVRVGVGAAVGGSEVAVVMISAAWVGCGVITVLGWLVAGVGG